MAEIKIYGTLVNDTAEAIARTTQVIDPTTGKNVNELIEAAKTAPYKPYMAANGMDADRAPEDLLTDSGTEWIDGFYAIGEDDEGFGFYPASVNSMDAYNKMRNYCGIAMEYDIGRAFYFPFAAFAPDIDPGDEHPIIGKVKFMPVLSPQGTLVEPVLSYKQGVGYGFTFNSIETGSGTGLTAWQKAYLEGLEKQEMADKFAATMTLSQTQKDFDGTATTVTVYVTPKFDGSNVDAVVTGTSSNLSGKTFTKGSDGRYSTQVTLNAPASVSTSSITETFSVMVKYTHATAGQLTKSLSATHTQNIKSYIMKEATDAVIINDLATRFGTAWKSANSLKGTHSIPIATGGEWVFLAVPKAGGGISKVTSSGFDVPMTSVGEDVSVAKGSSTIHYMVIRTSSKPQSTPFNIVIS